MTSLFMHPPSGDHFQICSGPDGRLHFYNIDRASLPVRFALFLILGALTS